MNKFKLLFPVVLFTAISTVGLSSCDNEYDLSKDINTDMKVGEYFCVPIGKTTNVELSRIIKESESIKPGEQAVYEVVTNGSTASSIDLAPVEVNITPYIGSAIINLPNIGGSSPLLKSASIDLPTLQIQSDPYNVDTALPKEVEALYRANLNNANTYLTLYIDSKDWPTGIDKIILTNFTITFPKIIESGQGNSTYKVTEPIILSSSSLSNRVAIPINAIDIPSELHNSYIVGNSGKKHLKLNERLQISANIKAEVSGKPSQNKVSINFSYISENAIGIKDVSGEFHTSANINEEIAINDIPDFLKNGQSSFTPTEVNFLLNLQNPVNIPWSASLEFQSFKADNSKKSELVNVPIAVNPGANKLLISNTPQADITVQELPLLFSFVPDKFSISSPEDIKLVSTNKSQTVELGKSYTINAKYDVTIPFNFSNFKIEYIDNIKDLAKDLFDVLDKIDTDVITVSATAESTIPAELAAKVKLFDAAGNSLDDGIEVDLTDCIIHAAEVSDNSKAKSSTINIKLSQTKDGYFKRLDRIEYTVNAENSTYPMTLRSNQHLCIKDIVAKIPNGIKVKL